jgi:hypothetical protein
MVVKQKVMVMSAIDIVEMLKSLVKQSSRLPKELYQDIKS